MKRGRLLESISILGLSRPQGLYSFRLTELSMIRLLLLLRKSMTPLTFRLFSMLTLSSSKTRTVLFRFRRQWEGCESRDKNMSKLLQPSKNMVKSSIVWSTYWERLPNFWRSKVSKCKSNNRLTTQLLTSSTHYLFMREVLTADTTTATPTIISNLVGGSITIWTSPNKQNLKFWNRQRGLTWQAPTTLSTRSVKCLCLQE